MTNEFEVGQRVCAMGQGTDALAHWHGKVTRLTKTMIIVTSQRGDECRFRREGIVIRSIPQSDWGGLSLSTTCQEKKNS